MIKAVNDFVFIIRDESPETMGELWLPESGRKKMHTGTVVSAGNMVKDPSIKSAKGKKVMFHEGVGFTVPYEGVEYLVVEGERIISVL